MVKIANQFIDSYIDYFEEMRWVFIGSLAFLILFLIIYVLITRGLKKEGAENEDTTSGRVSFMENGQFRIDIGNCQGVGEREEQQDAFAFSPNSNWKDKGFLAVLCDGMGGLDSGASISNKLVSDIIAEFPYAFDKLKDGWILDALSNEIYQTHGGRGGTTVVITYVQNDKMWFASVGDSDLFLLRNNHIYAMNVRQEYGNQLLMRAADGAISVDQALMHGDAPALTEFMGAPHVNADYSITPWQVMDNDVYLLCSDGISDTLSFDEIRQAMMHTPSECAELLEKGIMTKNKRFQDNYTAIVFSVHRIGGEQNE